MKRHRDSERKAPRPMKINLLIIAAFLFFLFWKKTGDPLLLFCTVFAAALWICLIINRSETTRTVIDNDRR